jgi:hypothetical protein
MISSMHHPFDNYGASRLRWAEDTPGPRFRGNQRIATAASQNDTEPELSDSLRAAHPDRSTVSRTATGRRHAPQITAAADGSLTALSGSAPIQR